MVSAPLPLAEIVRPPATKRECDDVAQFLGRYLDRPSYKDFCQDLAGFALGTTSDVILASRENGIVVGFAGVKFPPNAPHWVPRGTAYLSLLLVRRARRTDHGARLLGAAEDVARERTDRLWVYVVPANRRWARRFLVNRGYCAMAGWHDGVYMKVLPQPLLRVAFASFVSDPEEIRQGQVWQITEQWRVHWPTDALRARGHVVVRWTGPAPSMVEAIRQLIQEGFSKPDLVIVPRLFNPRTPGAEQTDNVVAWVNAMHQLGCAIAADFDDHPWYAGPAPAESTVTYLRMCDGVTVSTAALADAARAYVRPGVPVVVVPNAILPEPYLNALERGERSVPRVSIGWAGTRRSVANFEATGMCEAWGRIAGRYPDVKFVLIGDSEDDKLIDVLKRCGVPWERILTAPPQKFELYPYSLLNVDIACCSLIPTQFNTCKSPQKAWEFALMGAAVVCSPTVYADDERLTQCGGLLASNADEWEAHLARLIDNDQERRDRVESLRRFVLEERSIEANVWRWPDAWQTIVSAARPLRNHSPSRGDARVRARRKAERQNRRKRRA